MCILYSISVNCRLWAGYRAGLDPQRGHEILSNYLRAFKACNASAIKSDVCLMNGEVIKGFLEEMRME